MKSDYSGTNDFESSRSRSQEYWNRKFKLIIDLGIKPVSGEERIRKEQELFRKAYEKRRQQDQQNQQGEDDTSNVPV